MKRATLALVVTGAVAETWTEMNIPYGSAAAPFGSGPFTRTDAKRQHLHIFEVGSAPSPVFFWAHGNGADADALNDKELDTIASAGYSAISWESVTVLKDEADVSTCWADQDLVFEWAKANAAKYNLDMNNVVVGGRSRGSACSWHLAHSGKAGIVGAYFYNALPDPLWLGSWDPKADVTANSPPASLGYGPVCPKPITQACETVPHDIHNPRHGQTIVDRYGELGLDITLTDDMHVTQGGNVKDAVIYFPALLDSLGPQAPTLPPAPTPPTAAPSTECADKLAELCPDYTTPKQCSDCAKEHTVALGASGCTTQGVTAMCEEPPTQSMDKSDAVPQSTAALTVAASVLACALLL